MNRALTELGCRPTFVDLAMYVYKNEGQIKGLAAETVFVWLIKFFNWRVMVKSFKKIIKSVSIGHVNFTTIWRNNFCIRYVVGTDS